MKMIIDISEGQKENNNLVRFQLFELGRDFMLWISGGDSHIGALTCSDKNRNADTWQHTLIHHKEDVLVTRAMKKLKDGLPGELLVVAGVHYDDIDKEKIKEIVKHATYLLDVMVKEIACKVR